MMMLIIEHLFFWLLLTVSLARIFKAATIKST